MCPLVINVRIMSTSLTLFANEIQQQSSKCDLDLRRYIHSMSCKFLNVCPFDFTAVAGRGKFGPVNQVNHTSLVALVTPTDRPKSVRNRCVIELFVALFVLSLCMPFWHFCWCRGFCHRTDSDLFLFLQILKCLFYNRARSLSFSDIEKFIYVEIITPISTWLSFKADPSSYKSPPYLF